MNDAAGDPDALVVVGVGNADRRDDGAGPAVVARLATLRAPLRAIACLGDVAELVDRIGGSRRVVVVDAVAPRGRPGAIHRIDASRGPLPPARAQASTHGLGLAEALELLRALGRLPDEITILGIEGRDFGQGGGLSAEVVEAVEQVAAELIRGVAPTRPRA